MRDTFTMVAIMPRALAGRGRYLDEDGSWIDSLSKHPENDLLYVDKPVDIRSQLHASSGLHVAQALFFSGHSSRTRWKSTQRLLPDGLAIQLFTV
jgi:hypothetical protein